MLKNVINVTLKKHSDTRWSSKKQAISALHTNIISIAMILKQMRDITNMNYDTIDGCNQILRLIDLKFLCLLNIWNKILKHIDKTNKSLQTKDITIDMASKMLNGLYNSIQEIRDNNFEDLLKNAKNTAIEMELSPEFLEKRRHKIKRMDGEEAIDDGATSIHAKIKNDFYMAVDSILSSLKWRFKRMTILSNDFEFLCGSKLSSMDFDEIKKWTNDLAIKYDKDLNGFEFCSEMECFKHQASALMTNFKVAAPIDLLIFIHKQNLQDIYPNIEIALRIFLTIPVTTASCERSFSKLKLIKNYLRSTIGQERLTSMAILSIEHEFARQISYDEIIDEFSSLKARKENF